MGAACGARRGSGITFWRADAFGRAAPAGGDRTAGVEVHPHTLRHTFAKRLADGGIGLHEALEHAVGALKEG